MNKNIPVQSPQVPNNRLDFLERVRAGEIHAACSDILGGRCGNARSRHCRGQRAGAREKLSERSGGGRQLGGGKFFRNRRPKPREALKALRVGGLPATGLRKDDLEIA